MPCTKIKDGFICSFQDSFVNLEPYGSKVWMSFHRYLGPTFYRSKNAIKPIYNPSNKTWDAFMKWDEERKGDKQKAPEGA